MSASPAAVLLPGFTGTELPGWLARRLEDGLAGVCLFGTNVASRPQVRELTDEVRASRPDAVVAVDEEGGDVTRLDYDRGSPYPGNAVLGRIGDPHLTRAVGRAVGEDLAAAGITLDLAPDADVNSDPSNPVIGVRSFGADADEAAAHTAAWIEGLQSTGVAACAKHFPGHGDTALDSHLALPVVDVAPEVLRARELVPFAAAVAAGTRSVMTSHILLPQVDPGACATFSPRILEGLLRGELGFRGAIVSDALDMAGASGEIGVPEAAVRALAAGCDLLCIGTDTGPRLLDEIDAAVAGALADGRLPAERLAEAARRAAALGGREEAASSPADRDDGPVLDTATTAAAFDVRPGTRLSGPLHLVVLATEASVAVGTVPWGPAAAGLRVDQRVRAGGRVADPPRGARLVLVGRDNHRHAWVRDAVDDARTRHPGTVVVDMGWPGDDRAYADIATFGASRHVGEALGLVLAAATAEGAR